jgi:hypothetical protein
MLAVPLLAFVHLDPVMLLFTRPQEYFPIFHLLQSSSLIEFPDSRAVYVTSSLLNKPSRLSLGRTKTHFRKKFEDRNAFN